MGSFICLSLWTNSGPFADFLAQKSFKFCKKNLFLSEVKNIPNNSKTANQVERFSYSWNDSLQIHVASVY